MNAFILTVLEFVWTYPPFYISLYIVQVKLLVSSNTDLAYDHFFYRYSDYFDVARIAQVNVKCQ